MPTYEYRCGHCGHEMEAFLSITADPLRKCPSCKRLRLERLISAGAGVIFKGSGFYQTDYRPESYKKAAKQEKEAPKESSGTGETSTASGTAKEKPAAKNTKKE